MAMTARRAEEMEFRYQQCPGCSYNIATGTGKRSCNWYDCPYLPEELKIFCPQCNFNFATGEGSSRCGDPPTCQWAGPGFEHVANVVAFKKHRR